MTTPPLTCPECRAPLTGTAACTSCGLPLVGPLAYRLWQVDQQLALLAQQSHQLQDDRGRLLARLRAGETGPAPVTAPASTSWAGSGPTVLPPRHETSPQQVQNTLLTLGTILLAGAGIVFTAWAYRHLGDTGRASVLVALTAVAAAAPVTLLRRGLTATAESVAAVGVVLSLLTAYALRRAGLAEDVDVSSYWCAATAVLAAAAGGYGAVVPVRVARWASVLLAQLPLPFVLERVQAGPATASVVLAAQAGADALVAARSRLPRDVRALTGLLGGVLALGSLTAGAAAVVDHERGAWGGFTILAGVLALGAWQATDQGLRDALAAPVVPLLGVAAWAAARPELTSTQEPLVLVAVAVLGLQVVGLLPRDRRLGAAAGALAVTVVTLVVEAEAVLEALAGPFTWLADPWSRSEGTARAALGPDLAWDGTVVTLIVLAGAALAVVTAGLVLDRVPMTLAPTTVLLVLSAVTLPLGLATSYEDALLLLLVVAGILATAGLVLLPRARLVAVSLIASGAGAGLLAAVWSTADEDATLVVLAVVASLYAGLALALPGALTGAALVLGAAELAAYGVHQGLEADQVGGLLLVAVAACSVPALLLRLDHRWGAEAAGVTVAVAAVACAVDDPGWLSWVLAGTGLAALVVSTRRDRRAVGLVGGLLLSASSWVRLADAGVTSPEPYVAPLAVLALVAGWLRRRSHPTASSWEAYGAALMTALVPSLLRSFADDSPTRGLLVLLAAVAAVLVGGWAKQQAPLVIGGAVALVEVLRLLAPYADALPRWLLLAGLGLLLVLVGATYEARLRDLRRLRERFDRLA
ncbi:MAG TPA: hypothetical protein VM097_06780 [Mycobacteriales bacterium]|nr:hypothetical protein [Mycobacteriales bacterium]